MIERDDATERQVQAARPEVSTWLSANAGSGKTRVLTDRVARLLLSGVQPQNILCLTYTKAAASEMQNRLFRRLGEWAMLEDGKLRAALLELGVETALTPEGMRHSRTLFARAIEAPGGLKIQTIHSFCAALLRRFPLEAGVSPQFSEMEDRAARMLREEIIEAFASGAERPLVDGVARYLSDSDFEEITKAVVAKRNAFSTILDRNGALGVFGLPPGFDRSTLEGEVFAPGDAQALRDLVSAMRGGKDTDVKNAKALSEIAALSVDALPELERIFLTGKGAKNPFSAKIGSVPTGDLRNSIPDLMDQINPLMQRIEDARPRRHALLAAEKTLALHGFARAVLPEYERRKQLRGWLDFDDLIDKARHLLNDPAVAAWVLYRLDGGIDHILVDEAQDTSPEQWDVIERLAQEFTSGEGARIGVERTIFVVGDKKQSIYSFQGADPGAFDRMQAEFGRKLDAVQSSLCDLTLDYSFRSAATILGLVDKALVGRTQAGFPKEDNHIAFHTALPGRVDLWPPVQKVENPEKPHWSDPVDRLSEEHHEVILARQIAQQIKGMLDRGETLPDMDKTGLHRRPVRPGDFLILVKRRSTLFGQIIRACKDAGLPMAGADRMKVGAELAVRDLGALLSFLATPEDDLSLAIALKSPLFGWTEQELFTLAHGRGQAFLWERLREAEDHAQTRDILSDLMANIDFLRPFDLIERILNRHGGRENLLGRLGPEAEDGIDALLGQALGYERTEVPSLTGFLSWMETDDLTIKRQIGSDGDLIRVMTVHGAKGLEAPIVILPETTVHKPPNKAQILMSGETPVWKPLADDMPPNLKEVMGEGAEKQVQESLRLLYVALTRAEKWLIVAAAGDIEAKDTESWYQIIDGAMTGMGAVPAQFALGTGKQLQDLNWSTLPLKTTERAERTLPEVPEIYRRDIAPPDPRPEVLSPSDLGGAKALPGAAGDDEEAAKRHGTHVHLLLEHLPGLDAEARGAIAAHLLPDAAPEEVSRALAEAGKVLDAPELANIFAPDALAEVPVTATLGHRRIHGVIDRLIMTQDRILAVDFKSNAVLPDTPEACPEGILRQMGAYADALTQIYPGRRVEVAILWTRAPRLMSLPHDLVMAARARTPHLDLPEAAT